MIAIDLSKQQELGYDPKAKQQIDFTENLKNQSAIFFIIDDAKVSFEVYTSFQVL